MTEAQIASLLLALKMKGETPEERTALAQVMRGHAQHIPTNIQDAMDNCGTGGDKSFSFKYCKSALAAMAKTELKTGPTQGVQPKLKVTPIRKALKNRIKA